MTPRRLLLVLVAALLGVAAGPVTAGPAAAASGYCARGTGVTVVVDNGSLGGGTSVRCDPNGANTAGSTVVARAGYPLTYVQRQPGFVCRVSGAPASANCAVTPPSDAYWGLFWSDGRSGSWSYASVGIGSLKVPAGGFIGWRFQGSTRTDPGTAPVSPTQAPPKASATPKPTRTPTPSTKPAPPPSAPASTRAPAGAAATAPEQPRQRQSAEATGRASAKASAKATAKAQRTARQQARQQARKRVEQKAAKKAADRDTPPTRSAEASPDGTSTPSASATADPDPDLVAGEQAAGTGSGPLLPLVAGGLALVLLAAVGRLAWVRRRG